MRYVKKTISRLKKCYALSKAIVDGRDCLLVAAEKSDPCYLFDLEGNRLDTVWEEPGGVMTMVPVPGRDGAFMATHRFYSPNDSKGAMLVLAEREEEGWKITKLCDLPFVHRFDIVERNGVYYLIACALKSGHEYKDDWRFPGTVFACVLPERLEEGCLKLEPIREGLLRNHGYTRCRWKGVNGSLVSCQSGIYVFLPPAERGGEWTVEQLTDDPASDGILIDLDGDGQQELFTLSPFHGDQISIYRQINGKYQKVYDYPEKTPFLHAIDAGDLYGRPSVICGNREGKRDLMCFYYDGERKAFCSEVIDHDVGPANCLIFRRSGKPVILASNRETDEIALYEVERD